MGKRDTYKVVFKFTLFTEYECQKKHALQYSLLIFALYVYMSNIMIYLWNKFSVMIVQMVKLLEDY